MRTQSRRKFLSWLTLGASGSTFLQACSSPTATPTPVSGNVVVATPKDPSGTIKKLIDEFNATKNPVTAELREIEGASAVVKDTYTRSFARKDASFDILAVDNNWLSEFMAAGWLLPLDNLVTAEEKSRHFEIALQQATLKGKLHALTWYNHVGVLYYRKDLLDGANLKPPTTFDDLADTAAKLQRLEDGVFGFIYSAFPTIALSHHFLETLWGFGGEFINPADNKVLVNGEPGEKALNWWLDNIYLRKISPIQVTAWRLNDVQTIFSQGQTVFMQANSDMYQNLAVSAIAGKFDIATLPHASGQKPSGMLNSTYFAINANSKIPQASGQVLKYLNSPTAQKRFALATGQPPAHKELYQDKELLAKYPHFATIATALNSARLRPATIAYPQISAEVLQVQLIRALQQRDAVKNILQIITDRSQPLVR